MVSAEELDVVGRVGMVSYKRNIARIANAVQVTI